ncbi:MAG: saccharopine dehydrogenase family protein [Mycobacteriaceae bacterium]
MSVREFDVVVFGASSFVGKLTAAYLAEHAPAGTKIALAGRSEKKLIAVRDSLTGAAQSWPVIIADVSVPSTLDAMVARAQVLCTTVGPYLRYGEDVLAATVNAGTDYVDLTGEVPFVRYSIDKFADHAQSNGCRIVHSCGFDSIPSDLGAYLLHKKVSADGEGAMGDTTMVVRSIRGGASGGTVDSMRVIADLASDPQIRRTLLDPHALSTGPGQWSGIKRHQEPSDIAPLSARKVHHSLKGTLAPFFMSSYNTRVVRRSNALLDGAYGDNFHYGEAMYVGGIPFVSAIIAGAVSVGAGLGLGVMSVKPLRRLVDRFLPKPGEGPSETSRNKGHFTTETYTTTSTGKHYRSRMKAQGDPGYKATAVMLAESALSLALERDRLPKLAGILTPAAAMGDVLIERLRAAGFEIEVSQIS